MPDVTTGYVTLSYVAFACFDCRSKRSSSVEDCGDETRRHLRICSVVAAAIRVRASRQRFSASCHTPQ